MSDKERYVPVWFDVVPQTKYIEDSSIQDFYELSFRIVLNRDNSQDDRVRRLRYDIELMPDGNIKIGCQNRPYKLWKRVGYHLAMQNSFSESEFDLCDSIIDQLHKQTPALLKAVKAADAAFRKTLSGLHDEMVELVEKVEDKIKLPEEATA